MYRIQKPVNQGFIQFHFGLKGKGKFIRMRSVKNVLDEIKKALEIRM